MIKKIKEILFNIVDYNRDGKISNTEFYTAILIVLMMDYYYVSLQELLCPNAFSQQQLYLQCLSAMLSQVQSMWNETWQWMKIQK